jgi:hypothetical protein
LSRDFTIPDTSSSETMYLEDLEGWPDTAVFTANDYIRLRVIDRSGGGLVVNDVYGTVTSYADDTGGEQHWTFTTTTTGYSSADVIYQGSVVLDYGQTGSGSRGIWEVTVLDAAGAPYSQVQTWASIASGEPSSFTTHVRIGNLDGLSGVGLEYGLFAGEGVSAGDKYVLVTDQSAAIHNIALALYDDSDVQRIGMDPSVGASTKMCWMGPSSTSPRFVVYGDGDVWLSNLAISTGLGQQLFSQADGLLLLGPGCKLVSTGASTFEWTSTRGQVASGTGAFHTEAGRWPGSRALVIEEGTTNYELAPRMKESGSTGLAAGWTYSDNLGSGGDATYDVVVHPVSERGWLQRFYYTAQSGDSDDYVIIYDLTSTGTFAQDDYCTLSMDIKGSTTGIVAKLYVREYDSGAEGGTAHVQTISVTESLERF